MRIVISELVSTTDPAQEADMAAEIAESDTFGMKDGHAHVAVERRRDTEPTVAVQATDPLLSPRPTSLTLGTVTSSQHKHADIL